MHPTVRNGREHQLTSLERRMRELDERSVAAAQSLILAATRERRHSRGMEFHRELARCAPSRW